MLAVGSAVSTLVVCRTGRTGEEGDWAEGGCAGRGRVKLGLGLGKLISALRRLVPVGEGLRLLNLDIGLVKPLGLLSSWIGVTMEMLSRPSSSEVGAVRISAALSKTEGTD